MQLWKVIHNQFYSYLNSTTIILFHLSFLCLSLIRISNCHLFYRNYTLHCVHFNSFELISSLKDARDLWTKAVYLFKRYGHHDDRCVVAKNFLLRSQIEDEVCEGQQAKHVDSQVEQMNLASIRLPVRIKHNTSRIFKCLCKPVYLFEVMLTLLFCYF